MFEQPFLVMNTPPANNPPLEQYRRLSGFEQTLLRFFAVFYEPANPTLVAACLLKLDLRNNRGNRPTTANIQHYIQKFMQSGIFTEERRCCPELIETLTKMAVVDGGFTRFAKTIRAEAPLIGGIGKWSTRCWRAARDLRIGIYKADFDLIEECEKFLADQCQEFDLDQSVLSQVVAAPFDSKWLESHALSYRFYLLGETLVEAQRHLRAIAPVVGYLAGFVASSGLAADELVPFRRLLFQQLVLQGDLAAADALLVAHAEAFTGSGAVGLLLFLGGEFAAARAAFTDDLAHLRLLYGESRVAIFGIGGVIDILSRLQSEDEAGLVDIAEQISVAQTLFPTSAEAEIYEFLAVFAQARLNPKSPAGDFTITPATGALAAVIAGLCRHWLGGGLPRAMEEVLEQRLEKAAVGGYRLIALQCAAILAAQKEEDNAFRRRERELRDETSAVSLVAILAPEEPWKRGLEALIHLSAVEKSSDNADESARLVWVLERRQDEFIVTPKEQRRAAGAGAWGKGRILSLARLVQGRDLTFLSPQDRRILAAVEKIQNADGEPVNYRLDMDRALPAMIGHPGLFLGASTMTPVEFVGGEPELLVEERGDHLLIRFAQPIGEGNLTVHQESAGRFRIIKINDKHRRIAEVTGPNGLLAPRSAAEKVLAAIGNVSRFAIVHSVIASTGGPHASIRAVEADSTIYMHLHPFGGGFRLSMFVRPFPGSPYRKPGQGLEHITAGVGGEQLQIRRNLRLEEEKAREVEELCPILDLAMDMEQEGDREWLLEAPADCLQALDELQQIRDRVVVEWPEGERLSISHRASLSGLNLKIRTNRQSWFALSGQVALDQGRVIELKDLLARVKKNPGRFVELADGQYLALTQEFRKRLDDLNFYGASDEKNGDEVLLHPLAAIAMEEFVSQTNSETDGHWRRHLDEIHALQQYVPELPSTLRADLRDYQREGYNWLARLAHWGVGGCLADDMGLGKTVQSLAVILKYAGEGPSLVVTPTSVSANWLSEVNRFTPTLKIQQLLGRDRKEVITALGPFDLLVTTYTLLQQEEELLSAVEWQTVILDEAQAIKNSATKRSRAAMALKSRFRLLTTGTPIENHLGELWNLFHFINPGLLGTLTSFNERFAMPIERCQDRDARLKLKKLIRPFILRRIKSQVLEELPSRTEITLEVEMGQEEMHLYEAIRQQAIDALENSGDSKGRPLQILAEIMRLRQACCNPRLVDPHSTAPSAKLELFSATLDDLIESRHKVLVFSQFITHLQIIRELLEGKGIKYQYLDGATSAKLRKERVDDFQAGIGDVFLISLKAGGLGLNLTAADYVIHMDPWWNPAIEDQASDRAHRIGQTRPVTIYRLVCKNTIEEKIVKLHQDKRELAGSLLEGSDLSARLSSSELLDLIRNG
ncbi:MAG: DEAD/DEAH box helicase [Desulfobulbaceae bacterium]|jgi:superfamily II DNA or RNA helicase|nr:DEAD/DEAH box helicase [Desulfobulbaceae bacterium]